MPAPNSLEFFNSCDSASPSTLSSSSLPQHLLPATHRQKLPPPSLLQLPPSHPPRCGRGPVSRAAALPATGAGEDERRRRPGTGARAGEPRRHAAWRRRGAQDNQVRCERDKSGWAARSGPGPAIASRDPAASPGPPPHPPAALPASPPVTPRGAEHGQGGRSLLPCSPLRPVTACTEARCVVCL